MWIISPPNGPPKKASTSDPLISHGRHFGRTVFALCNYPSLLTNGILRLEQMEETPLEDFSSELLSRLLERLKNGSEEEILHVGELIGKGAAGARGDDTKTLKSAVLDWISPKGDTIQPHLHRNSKIDRGFNHELTGSLLCPAGMGLERPRKTSGAASVGCGDQWPRMSCVTLPPYLTLANHVRQAATLLTDTTTDSETFYHSLLDLLEDPEECKEVDELLTWWNRQVFPTLSAAKRPISANSALSKIRQKRLAVKRTLNMDVVSS
ncbi:hypothetical protein BD769DRAFT_1628188 [Suillus cothurnatus]|nr:hypothetical protein BD769DRAFT_1628188 [Suillus cothurnatus]